MILEIGQSVIETDAWRYVIMVLAGQAFIRAVTSFLRTLAVYFPPTKDLPGNQESAFQVRPRPPGRIRQIIWMDIASTSKSYQIRDYLQPALLGLIELSIYPILIAVPSWTPIGAWIALKTILKWRPGETARRTHDRFLIGNALVIAASIWIAAGVHVHPVRDEAPSQPAGART